ncbi:MAG: hypothetical protein AMJ55_04385 [Gammaproteobacteria bacterium SG8_15]|nr:MAG: hypothetical protein AMJ55_04385 [Gammaproteobacteria bacterium SG8_15]
MLRPVVIIFTVLIVALLSSNVHAACTYNEAVIAFNSGNQIRGHALMKMAARDGDQRAVHFLNSNEFALNDRDKDRVATGHAGKALNVTMREKNVSTDAMHSNSTEQDS